MLVNNKHQILKSVFPWDQWNGKEIRECYMETSKLFVRFCSKKIYIPEGRLDGSVG